MPISLEHRSTGRDSAARWVRCRGVAMRSAGESSEWRIVKLVLFEVGSKQVVIIVEFEFESEYSR